MTSMVNLSWLPPILVQASERLAGNLSDLAGGATVWLAVTGLSRSGKTVFITSLIHNLLSSLHNPNRMPLLNAYATFWWRTTRLVMIAFCSSDIMAPQVVSRSNARSRH